MKHLCHTALRLSILPILLFVLSVSCKEPTATRSYTVSFETNGGTAVKTQTVKEGKKASQPDNPTREGYTFGGWYRDKALTQSFAFNTAIPANITLYAKWVQSVTVTFQANGGSTVDPITVATNSKIKKPDNPTKQDSIFGAWYTDNTFQKSFEFANTPITADITLYAKWNPITYTVSFQTNGGSPITPKTTTKGNTITPPDNPTRENYGFGGWGTDNTFQKSFDFNTAITSDITLYAKWNPIIHTVAFQTNGGAPVASITIAKGNTIQKPTPTKGKSTLLSWYKDNALTQPFSFNTPITADITLYAKYGFRIPDDNFRNKLKTLIPAAFTGDVIDTAHSDVTRLNSMSVPNAGIKSLAGIKYFTRLTQLSCKINQLTSLDVATNTALTELNCSTNQLTRLDVATNTALTQLDCQNNQLTRLDVATNTALTSLFCNTNKLTSLDVATNTALTQLYCTNNQLTSLDIATNTALTSFYCNTNKLTSLDVATNTALTSLFCTNNQLTSLDIATNTALTQLYCTNNQLTSLDIATNTALTSLFCNTNKLTSLDVATNTALTRLFCTNNQLTSLDVSKNTALTSFYCSNNQLTSLDVATNTALIQLYCSNNQLTSLDVATNTALTTLDCTNNQLTSLNMRGIGTGLLTRLDINAGEGGKNLLTSMRVLAALKDHAEIKGAKTNRGGDIIITVYNDTDRTTVICNNYDPNQSTCLDP